MFDVLMCAEMLFCQTVMASSSVSSCVYVVGRMQTSQFCGFPWLDLVLPLCLCLCLSLAVGGGGRAGKQLLA